MDSGCLKSAFNHYYKKYPTVSPLTTPVSKMKEQRKKYLDSQIFHCLHYKKYEVKMNAVGMGLGTGEPVT